MPAAASRHGVLRLSAEIGGGAETGQALVDRCREGLLGCLHELGLLNRELARPDPPAPYDLDAPAATLRARARRFHSRRRAWPAHSARVSAGRLIEPARPDTPAHTLLSPQAGTVLCLRAIARSDDGDCSAGGAGVAPGLFPRCTDPC